MRTAAMFLALLCACKTHEATGLFEDLAMYWVKEFPVNVEQARTDPTCARYYAEVQRGRARLFTDGSGPALARTIAEIEATCVSSRWTASPGHIGVDEGRCHGAAVAMWYLSSESEDEALRRLFARRPELLASIVRTIGVQPWANNRPDPKAWVPLIASAPIDDFTRATLNREIMQPERDRRPTY